MPVPFTVLCPTCGGAQYIYNHAPAGGTGVHDDPTAGYPCPTCDTKGYLQKGGRVRTDKLHILHKRITRPEMTCPFCKEYRHTRKKCRHCKSTRLRADAVILRFKSGDITLWKYLTRK
ncbi:hypothetical protein GF391_04240 [Candidatus Uhrbacteria bacterium]|nr:hypothetical protein [Candidatus Uhrbacteria bacterium]